MTKYWTKIGIQANILLIKTNEFTSKFQKLLSEMEEKGPRIL